MKKGRRKGKARRKSGWAGGVRIREGERAGMPVCWLDPLALQKKHVG